MNSFSAKRTLWAASCLALALGAITILRAAFKVGDYSRKLQVYAEDARKLRKLGDDAERNEAAVRRFEQLPNPRPAPVAQLLKNTLPGLQYKVQEHPSRPTLQGWRLRRMEISFANAPLNKLADFLAKAESQRPPWRLTTCTIRALGPSGGAGEVTVVLEALDKTP